MVPNWLYALSVISLVVAVLCAIIIIIDERRHPQHMWIMNAVWPLCALFGSVIIIWMYFTHGRSHGDHHAMHMMHDHSGHSGDAHPTPNQIATGTLHCGSGCTLGDIIAEWLAFFVPTIAVWFGWHSLFSEKIFAVWVLDFVVALSFGIIFQYFALKPMRDLTVSQALVQAIKADVLSLTFWQIGMYGFMAIAHFYLFPVVFAARLDVPTPEFWFMMQIAMICGFITAYPVNVWLIRRGVKEAM